MIVATITLIKMILIIMMIAVTSATLNIFYRCKILRVYKSFSWPGIETETTSRLRSCYSNGSVAWRHVVSKGFERACPLSCSGQKLPSSQHLPASLKVGEAWRGTQISLHMSMLLALPLALLNPITNLVLSDEMAMGQTSGLKQGWPSQGWLMQNDAKRRKNGRSDSLKKIRWGILFTEKLVDSDASMSFSFHDVEEGLSFFIWNPHELQFLIHCRHFDQLVKGR